MTKVSTSFGNISRAALKDLEGVFISMSLQTRVKHFIHSGCMCALECCCYMCSFWGTHKDLVSTVIHLNTEIYSKNEGKKKLVW